jgi:hypothetical protein
MLLRCDGNQAISTWCFSWTAPKYDLPPEREKQMTRSAIAEELWPLLNGEPQKKQDVVFVLIQIRKLLEYDGKPAQYKTLKFFCDWVAHPKLAGTGAKDLLRVLDNELPTFDRRNSLGWDPKGVVHKILSFDLLRNELLAFLHAEDLPTRWAEDEFTWKSVVQFYGQQVHKTPLVFEEAKSTLNYIRSVEITELEPVKHIVQANPGQKFYGFK